MATGLVTAIKIPVGGTPRASFPQAVQSETLRIRPVWPLMLFSPSNCCWLPSVPAPSSRLQFENSLWAGTSRGGRQAQLGAILFLASFQRAPLATTTNGKRIEPVLNHQVAFPSKGIPTLRIWIYVTQAWITNYGELFFENEPIHD